MLRVCQLLQQYKTSSIEFLCDNFRAVAVIHRRPCLKHLAWQAVKPDIGSESRFLPTTPAFDAPLGGGWGVPVGILSCRLVWEN